MLIIPVIDLMNGLVVHAKKGQRNDYQPIQSKISKQTTADAVVSGFLELYPFKVIYIADLDTIMGKGSNQKLILELASRYQQCEFWIDAGINLIVNNDITNEADNIKFVMGSENKLAKNKLDNLIINNPELILSLDFVEGALIENNYLLTNSSLWPEHIITMMLSRVGTNEGVDIDCLNTVLKLAAKKNVYVAGGVRNIDDIKRLKTLNVAGVLLASALHNGSIKKDDLEYFYSN